MQAPQISQIILKKNKVGRLTLQFQKPTTKLQCGTEDTVAWARMGSLITGHNAESRNKLYV